MTLRELEDSLDRLENLLRKEKVSPRIWRAIESFACAAIQLIGSERIKLAIRKRVWEHSLRRMELKSETGVEYAPLVLSLCDLTGRAVEPWAAVGYECWTVDLQHPPGVGPLNNGVRRVGADVIRWCPPLGRPVAFVFAFPPCTHLAVSGARWFKGKGLDALADSLRIVAACNRICEASNAPFLVENPVSTLSTYWRKPDYTFDPCDFAGYLTDPDPEAYTKKTCLWVGNGFVMPPTRRVEPTLGSKMHMLSPSEERANLRSVTPRGFSMAVFEANFPHVSRSSRGLTNGPLTTLVSG